MHRAYRNCTVAYRQLEDRGQDAHVPLDSPGLELVARNRSVREIGLELLQPVRTNPTRFQMPELVAVYLNRVLV
jgi:hypothetical protein